MRGEDATFFLRGGGGGVHCVEGAGGGLCLPVIGYLSGSFPGRRTTELVSRVSSICCFIYVCQQLVAGGSIAAFGVGGFVGKVRLSLPLLF